MELARAIAAPTVGRICATLGATVIRVSSATNTELPITFLDGCIGKISVDINLKTFEGRKKLMELIKDADVFIDGYRPSVLEHLGFGRDAVLGLVSGRERGIVYCQENCYGWKGPWKIRPGWAQIADTVRLSFVRIALCIYADFTRIVGRNRACSRSFQRVRRSSYLPRPKCRLPV